MSAPATQELRRGWCPGALRPMQTGDGLLVRLRITGGIVSARLARSLSEASREYGNGLFDLSARGNLQLRGVTAKSLQPLTNRLTDLGLLDDNPAAESVRNVVASPLAGLDPAAVLDIRLLVERLEQALVRDEALHALPGKFGFAVDDGGRIGLDDVTADVRFRAVKRPGRAPEFMVSLAGTGGHEPVAFCETGALADAAAAVALAFLRLRGDPAGGGGRMASLVAQRGAASVFAEAGLRTDARPASLPVRWAADVFGLPATHTGVGLALAAPFGRWTADDLALLGDLADRAGSRELRLTPYRAIIVPLVAKDAADELAGSLAGRFITSADDPRLAVAACPGAPACGNGTTATHADALALAPLARGLAPEGLALHVSGCAKGCAHPAAAPATLIGRDGRYDLVQNGTAADAPWLTNLTLDEARTALLRLGKDIPT